MNISIFYVDNRAFTSGKDCVRAFRIRCNIATFDVNLATLDTEDYCILTTEIAVVITCSVARLIENAIFNINYRFIFTDESILVGCCVCHRFVSNGFVFCNDSCAFKSTRLYFNLWCHTIRGSILHSCWRHTVRSTRRGIFIWRHLVRRACRGVTGRWFAVRCTVWRCTSLCGWYCFSLFCCGYNCYVGISLSLYG